MDESASKVVEWLKDHSHKDTVLELDSRAIRPRDIFVAVPGAKVDGRNFIRVAAARGAAAVLTEAIDEPEHFPIPVLGVHGLKSRLGEIADLFYARPSSRMLGIVATGTNGKTTTTHWVSQLFSLLGTSCAVLGTVGCFYLGSKVKVPNLTTPDAASLHHTFKILSEMGARAFAMEASSIGLEQGRVSGTSISTAIFTNLTRDHLDYHKSMLEYAKAKEILFAWPGLKNAVINVDDVESVNIERVARKNGSKIWKTSISESYIPKEGENYVCAKNVQAAQAGMSFDLKTSKGDKHIEVPVVGSFNVSNLVGVVACALAEGFDFELVASNLCKLEAPEGRMQVVSRENMPLAVVDYSHTPDALEKALKSLRPIAKRRNGKLSVVFGCGGDRDSGKRPIMGEVAAKFADTVFITSDNPRSEDPIKIVNQIAASCPKAKVVVDRKEAIFSAVLEANNADVLLIAGKGHEDYQEINGIKHHFLDKEVVTEAFNERFVVTHKAK